MMRSILIGLILTPLIVSSQNGPGGIGDRTGSSFLNFWFDGNDLDADGEAEGLSESVLSGSSVNDWYDKSGYGNDAGATGTSPLYNLSGNNGYPKVDFSRVGSLFTGTFSRANEETIFCVSTSTTTSNCTVYDGHTTNQRRMFSGGGYSHMTIWAGTSRSNTGFALNNTIITRVFFSNSASEEIQVNQNTTVTGNAGSNTTTAVRLGCANTNYGGNGLQGDISEFILYSGKPNDAQKIILYNYLSSKYNVALSTLDLYDEDDSGNGDYDHDVAGIGRTDASNIHNDSRGTGIVRILNPTGLNDDEYLFWGHDNGDKHATESSDVPIGVDARFERVWRVSEVNSSSSAIDVGSIDIRFDLSYYSSITASDLRLLVDTDNDAVFSDETPISGATSLGGGIYEFAAISSIANNLRFTLGTSDVAQSPLPINLVSFSVFKNQNKNVLVTWKTASETNNDFFTIEQSSDGLAWKEVSTIQGAGNSNLPLNYSYLDTKPNHGTSYYRLKQTDFDGKFSYSKIKSLAINDFIPFTVYTNPSNNQIRLYSIIYMI